MIEQNKIEEAIAVLEKVVKSEDFNPQMRQIAVIKLASYKLDYAPSQEIQEMLEPLVKENGVWTNIAKELLAMLAVRDNDFDRAKTLYQEISVAANTPETLKARAQDMLNVIDEAQKKQ